MNQDSITPKLTTNSFYQTGSLRPETFVSWKDRMIDLRKDYPEPEFILEFRGMKFFTKGDIVVIKGKPKKGKSHLMIAFIIALLSGEYIDLRRLKQITKILYVDCEMHANYTALLARKIHYASRLNINENSNDLCVLNLKGDTPSERERFIENAIIDIQPDIVFIDGVKDITRTEPNDQTEGKRIGEELKQWTSKYDCLIAIAIHENKNDLNSRGAVGAAVEEISSEVWRIDRNIEGVFTASQTLFRYHSPVEDLCFTMDEKGNIQREEPQQKVNPEDLKKQKMEFAFREVFTNYEKLTFNSLQDEYMKAKRVKQTAAYNAIMWAVNNGIIVKNLVGLYELTNLTLPHK